MNKRDKLEREIKAVVVIEDEFKALGKCLYACWLDKKKVYNFQGIMSNFDNLMRKLLKSKLKETKK
jgi:hypothetical protein